MGTHFLVSLFDDQINGVVAGSGSPPQSTITGNYVIRVPDDVSIRNPTNLADLLTKKYAGILGSYGLFTQIAYDDMLDGSGVNTGLSQGVTLGFKGMVGIYPTNDGYLPSVVGPNPVLQTTPMAIAWGGPGAGPPQALLTYELFEYVDDDDKDLPYVRRYREVAPDIDVVVEVSFDGGSNFTQTTDKALISIPLPERGASVVVRFTRDTDVSSRGRVLIGSWSVLF